MAEPMQQQAERYLGTAIEPQEWRRACESAERKLQHIIKHYGDSGGQRREPGYMAQLIAEAVRSDRLRRLTARTAIWGQKRTARVRKHRAAPQPPLL